MPAGLEPFVPTASDPWDAAKAGHLLRRAGFGPLPNEVAAAVAAGPDRAVDALFAFAPEPAMPEIFGDAIGAERQTDTTLGYILANHQRPKDHPELRALYQVVNQAHGRAIVALTAWWLDRMAASPSPLQEKLTLFWHGHFTSSFGDVNDAMALYYQNALFRRHAAGNFARLLDGVARDPAMLRYLNNDQNRKGHPNENWARELMELFTLGIGHYTEDDVRESARAWTGWTLRDYRSFEDRRSFAFKPALHDGGQKTFLGQTGAWDGTDIMRIILAQAAAPRWIAGKLAAFFAAPQPPADLVDAVAAGLRENTYELRPALRALFRSRAFYRPEVMHAQVKSPTEFVVGAVRQLGVQQPDWIRLSGAMALMGQHLFFPPTVAGWDGGARWMNAGTIFTRSDVAAGLIAGRLGAPNLAPLGSAEAITTQLLGRTLSPARQTMLAQAAVRSPGAAIHLVMALPEYQVA
ncbi:MAG TPA: DUF1800 domain-containing protein [bacterium]|nr:DUF1800 domain-containing protein [bacterium]